MSNIRLQKQTELFHITWISGQTRTRQGDSLWSNCIRTKSMKDFLHDIIVSWRDKWFPKDTSFSIGAHRSMVYCYNELSRNVMHLSYSKNDKVQSSHKRANNNKKQNLDHIHIHIFNTCICYNSQESEIFLAYKLGVVIWNNYIPIMGRTGIK